MMKKKIFLIFALCIICTLAARYDEGVLTDVKIIANPLMTGNIEMDGTGEQFKLFLLDLAECKPLCENWKNQ